MEPKEERIKTWMAAAMVIVAFSVDCFEMLLEWLGIGIFGFSSLLSMCAALTFWIWYKILGVSFSVSPKKFATQGLTSFLEIVPGLDAIGGFIWTIGTIMMVTMVRAEDKGGLLSQAVSMVQPKKNNIARFPSKTRTSQAVQDMEEAA